MNMMGKRYQLFMTKYKPVIRVFFVLLLSGLSFSYAMFQGGFVSWFLFYSFLPFVIFALLLLFFPMQSFHVERQIVNQTYHSGDTVYVKLFISRKRPFPLLFLIVDDLLPEALTSRDHKQLIFPGFRKKLEIEYTIFNVPRGEHQFNQVRLMTSDILGFITKESQLETHNTILVYPQIEEIVYRPLETRFERGGTASATQFQKDTSLVAGVRQYQPGDRFSWIDWKATARTNEVMSKEFENRQTNDLLFILDRRKSENFEELVTFVASAIKAIIHNGGQVGLFSAGKDRTFFPIRSGEQQERQIFHHLAKVRADSSHSITSLLNGETALYQQPAVLIVVTSLLDQQMAENLAGARMRKGPVIIYHLKKRTANNPKNDDFIVRHRSMLIRTLYEDDIRSAFLEVPGA